MPRDRILIVEDDLDFAMLESEVLSGEFECDVVSSLAAAAQRHPESYDAIVLDYNMPDGPSLALVHQVGAVRPVVIVTGETAVEPAVEAFRAGASHWLAKKPENLSVLPLVLRQAIDERRTREAAEKDRRAAEESLRQSETRYRLLVDNVSDIIFQMDLAGRILFVTPSVRKVLGYDEADLVGRPYVQMLAGASVERATGVLRDRLAAGATPPYYPVVLELEFARRDQTTCTCEVHAVFVRDERGVPQSLVAVIRDISERTIVAEALHRNEDEIEALALEVAQLRGDIRQRYVLDSVVGRDPRMQEIFRTVVEVGRTSATVLVQGETGTGKDLVAKAIHYNSLRRDRPFVKVDCGALAETLLESELFGHVKGAFTGAVSDRRGRFELANGGTIFLDEIHNLSIPLQAKLLRVVQDGAFEKVGGSETLKVDVRIVTATNEDLRKLVDEKKFRMDLFYRLNVIPILVPPLRERLSDIPLLVESFIARFSERHGRRVTSASPAALEELARYRWPGNVRELENIIEQAVVFCQGETLGANDIHLPSAEPGADRSPATSPSGRTLREVLEPPERRLIVDALKRCSGNRKHAAEVLGISRSALYEKLRRHGIIERG